GALTTGAGSGSGSVISRLGSDSSSEVASSDC
ncbi:hypothetical protein A2U01_0113841, partial [Trifolium medium]|nr:hypothetical protein [Trifolium medium]